MGASGVVAAVQVLHIAGQSSVISNNPKFSGVWQNFARSCLQTIGSCFPLQDGLVVSVVIATVVVTQVLHIPLHICLSWLPNTESLQNSTENKGDIQAAGSATPLHEKDSRFVVAGLVVVMGAAVV